MALPQSDFDCRIFFDHARQTADEYYASDPTDADNLMRWGRALLELSHFHTGQECLTMVKEAITRLEEAVKVYPKKYSALLCLGNAHTSSVFLSTDRKIEKLYFTKAAEYFQQAINEDLGNELYLKSVEVTIKFSQAPDFHLELQRQAVSEAGYKICGWIILAVGLIAWIRMVKSQLSQPQS